jgi:CRP-like cAMP-binding protein
MSECDPFLNWRDRSPQPSVANIKNEDIRKFAEAPHSRRFSEGVPTLFAGVPASEYAAILAGARRMEFARGEVLYGEGESVRQVMLVTSGLAKIKTRGVGGTEVILRLSVPGEVLGADALRATDFHSTTAQAFQLCRVLAWDAPTFKAIAQRFPVLQQNVDAIRNEYVLELEERFCELATEKVGPRVARQLLRLALTISHPIDGLLEIPLGREQLAQMTGTTLFTVSRLLSAWEVSGVVKSRGHKAVIIRSIQALRVISTDGRRRRNPLRFAASERAPE